MCYDDTLKGIILGWIEQNRIVGLDERNEDRLGWDGAGWDGVGRHGQRREGFGWGDV